LYYWKQIKLLINYDVLTATHCRLLLKILHATFISESDEIVTNYSNQKVVIRLHQASKCFKGHFHYGCAALRFAALRCDSQR